MTESLFPIYDELGNQLPEWDETCGWVEWNNGTQNEDGEWIQAGVYHPYTAEELAQIKAEQEEALKASPEYRVSKMESLMNIFLGVSE